MLSRKLWQWSAYHSNELFVVKVHQVACSTSHAASFEKLRCSPVPLVMIRAFKSSRITATLASGTSYSQLPAPSRTAGHVFQASCGLQSD